MPAKTVLIVEDQYDNRVIYREMLHHERYKVVEAENGEEGVRLAKVCRPDVGLMDLSMPVMDGWEAMIHLRADPQLRELPVIALTAHVVMDGDFRKSQQAGFAAYMTKPIEPAAVLRKIREILPLPKQAVREEAGDSLSFT